MSCKPFKTTEANAKSFLRTKGAIDNFLNILDLNKFRQFHGELINQAKKYIPNFSDKLFYEQNGGKKAIPNTQAFKDIDKAKKSFNNSQYQKLTQEEQNNLPESNTEVLKSSEEFKEIGDDFYMGDEALKEQDDMENLYLKASEISEKEIEERIKKCK